MTEYESEFHFSDNEDNYGACKQQNRCVQALYEEEGSYMYLMRRQENSQESSITNSESEFEFSEEGQYGA